MATPTQFARRIRRRAKQVEENSSKAAVEAALLISQTVIVATPVDTGRARANWFANIGTPITQESDGTDPSGAATIARNAGIIPIKLPGQTIFLSNNLPYIQFLNEGSSAQAPAMFVEQAIATAVRFLRTRVRIFT